MRLPAGIAALLLAFVAGAAEAPKYSNPDDPAVLAADVLFDFDKHDLRAEAVPSLEKVAEVLRSRAGSPVTIDGHTDGKGTDAYNLPLSQKRAQAVRDWLVKKGVATAAKITTKGWGKSKPIVPNARPDGSDDPEGRKKNRRVEITVRTG